METDKCLSKLKEGDQFEGFYILKSADVRTSSNGKPYLSATLSDVTAAIDAKMWDYSGRICSEDEGRIVKIRADVQEFKGSLQLTLKKLRLADENDEYSMERLVPCAPIDCERETQHIRELIASMADEDYRRLSEEMLRRHIDTFVSIPAAKSVHHAFLSGLLMHTGSMMRLADFLARELYGKILNRSLLLTGTLLHDFAKEREYMRSELGLINDVTTEGRLLGHLVMGAEEVNQVGKELGIPEEKLLLLRHMLLSHHGEPEFGAAVIPCIAEAEVLYHVDLLDSRMEIYKESLENVRAGSFSDKIYALDKRIYNHGIKDR